MMRAVLLLFGALNDADMRWLAQAGQVRRLAPGDRMINAGDPPQDLLIILEGRAAVLRPDGTRLALRREGETLGEMSFVETRPASATVVAAEPMRLLRVPAGLLRRHLEADLPFAARFYRGLAVLLADRLREATAAPGAGAADDLDAVVLGSLTRAGDRFRALMALLPPEAS